MNPVQWLFVVGGVLFLLAALVFREMPGEDAQILALTFGLIGVFWLVPQLIIWLARRK